MGNHFLWKGQCEVEGMCVNFDTTIECSVKALQNVTLSTSGNADLTNWKYYDDIPRTLLSGEYISNIPLETSN